MKDKHITMGMNYHSYHSMHAIIEFLEDKEKVLTQVEMRMNKNGDFHSLNSKEIENQLGQNQSVLYYNYYVITFQIYDSCRWLKDYPRLYVSERFDKSPNILELHWNFFKATFNAHFDTLENKVVSLKMNKANDERMEEAKFLNKCDNRWVFEQWIQFPKPDQNSLQVEYYYTIYNPKTTQTRSLKFNKTFLFKLKDVKNLLMVLNSEVVIDDYDERLKPVTNVLYSSMTIDDSLIEELTQSFVEKLLFFDENNHQAFNKLNNKKKIECVLIHLESKLNKKNFLDSIAFFLAEHPMSLCVFNLEKLIQELNITQEELNFNNHDLNNN